MFANSCNNFFFFFFLIVYIIPNFRHQWIILYQFMNYESKTDFNEILTSKTQDISRIQIQEKGIAKLLSKLNINKATISCRILREAADEIAPYLKFIFEKSLELKNVPYDWRTANITALFKKGDRSKPVNYRPISLTSVPCKILEHIIFKHIMEHLETHNILADFQHGFRENKLLRNTVNNQSKKSADTWITSNRWICSSLISARLLSPCLTPDSSGN